MKQVTPRSSLRPAFATGTLLLAVCGPAFADAVANRQAEYMNAYYDDFRNSADIGVVGGRTIGVAHAAFALGKPAADLFDLNDALDQYLTANANIWPQSVGQDSATIDTYWELPMLASMVLDPNLSSQVTPSNQAKIKDYLVSFSDTYDRADRPLLTPGNDPTRIFSSGNHDMHAATVHFMTAQIVKDDPAYNNHSFPGGYTPEQRYGQWNTKLLEYFQDRAGKGQSVEVGSPVYQPTYMRPLLHVAEYAEDDRLKEISREYIDLHYADLAQETIEGIRGGAKSRSIKNRSLTADTERSRQYIYSFIGTPDTGLADLPTGPQLQRMMGAAMTTDYRVPQAIADMMLDDEARGSYTYVTNRMAEGVRTVENGEIVNIPSATQSSMLRTTRVTPDYTLGWFTLDETKDYMAISSQSQSMGVITDASLDSRLVVNLTGGKVTDELQAVGFGDAVLIRKQVSKHVGEKPRVYVAPDFNYNFELDGWVFGTDDSGAYFAVQGRLPAGATTFTTADASSDLGAGDYLVFDDEDTVVVLQMGRAGDYASFADFQADVRSNTLTYDANDGSLTYDAGTPITMFNDTRVPHVGGQVVDLTPDKTWDSPYLNGDYGANVVTFTDLQGNSFDLDFNYNPVAPTQQRTTAASTTQTGVFSPGYREMVGMTEFSSNSIDPLTYAIDPTSTLQIDFDAYHDVMDTLVINGDLQLGGELLVNTVRGAPTEAGVYQVFSANNITGAFDTLTLPVVGSGLIWNTDNLSIDGTIALRQGMSITLGDINTNYGAVNPDDNPFVDPAFEADLQAVSANWTLLGLDEDGRNDARAMTFGFTPLDPLALESVWIEVRVQGLSGYENDNMALDAIGNNRKINAMQGYVEGGGWMTIRYDLDPAEFALLADGQLNLAFFDDTLVDWVTLSWLEAAAVTLEGDFNADGVIDLLDFDILAQHFGLTSGGTLATGDANADGAVNLLDFDLLAQNFGAALPGAVPEPASVALLALGGLAAWRR
ncbi:MAG: dockerin type I domain-containing protein [Planctomycetota bacterium]